MQLNLQTRFSFGASESAKQGVIESAVQGLVLVQLNLQNNGLVLVQLNLQTRFSFGVIESAVQGLVLVQLNRQNKV